MAPQATLSVALVLPAQHPLSRAMPHHWTLVLCCPAWLAVLPEVTPKSLKLAWNISFLPNKKITEIEDKIAVMTQIEKKREKRFREKKSRHPSRLH